MKITRRLLSALALAGALVALGMVRDATAGPTPGQLCQAGKNVELGKYALCRQKAAGTVVKTGDGVKYAAAVSKCESTLSAKWAKLELNATLKGASCPSTNELAAIRAATDEFTGTMVTALSGGPLQDCGNGTVELPEQCDGTDLAGRTCATEGFPFGVLRCSSGCTLDTKGCLPYRYYSDGLGTVIDYATKLQWEKKTGTVGSSVICSTPASCPDPHHVNNAYTWTTGTFEEAPDGTAFTYFLGQGLNGASGNPCFAGRCDWRLPSLEELQTLRLAACDSHPPHEPLCIDPVFGPTSTNSYWTNSASPTGDQDFASVLDFSDGTNPTSAHLKAFANRVRAVRNWAVPNPSGVIVGGYRWFLGDNGESCTAACAATGRVYDLATRDYAGSAGTDAHCQAVLSALGLSGTVVSQLGSNGFGCHWDEGLIRYRSHETTADAKNGYVYRACACQ